MMSNIFFLSFVVSFIFIVFILYLIRKRLLREQYALLWLILSVFMTVLSIFPAMLDKIARIVNVSYPPSLLYFLGFMGVLFILLHITVVVSKLTERSIKLAQLLAIQKQQLEQLRTYDLPRKEEKVEVEE